MTPLVRREPYLSVVVATRNDDHGGDPLKRLQAFVNTFAAQCALTGLDAELVVVEWNPPADRPRVRELLRIPSAASFAVTFVEVPSEIHERFRYADVLPLFQMIAKNVGIRRARGRFVLATNIDIIFSTELVEYLAAGQLAPGRVYRVERYDIEADFPIDALLDRQMEYCRTHQLRVHRDDGTHAVDRLGRLKRLEPDITGCAAMTLGDGWHVREGDAEYGFYRWAMPEARFSIDSQAYVGLQAPIVIDIEVEPNPYQPNAWVELKILADGRQLASRRVSRRITTRLAFDRSAPPRDFVLQMLDSSGGREWLPVFDARPQLCYRVRRISIATIPSHVYEIGLWRRFGGSATLNIEQTKQGIEITSDRGRYSYCARYPSFEAPVDGVYEFLLEHVTFDGNFDFSALDDERRCWLPSKTVALEHDGVQLVSLSVEVRRGTKFSLIVSNNQPSGGVSGFVLRRLAGSVPFDRLRSSRAGSKLAARVAEMLGQPSRQLKAAISSVERKRAQRFEDIMLDDSPRVRDLEAQVATLAPLAQLSRFAQLLREYRPDDLYQNACGDFQLMAREHWFALRGYPEFEMFSMSIDGLFEAMAVAAGITEHILETPRRIYHLEHEKGSGWTPEGEALLSKRIVESGITWLDRQAVHIWTTYMLWLRRPMIFNGADWGLGQTVLPETTFPASLETRATRT